MTTPPSREVFEDWPTDVAAPIGLSQTEVRNRSPQTGFEISEHGETPILHVLADNQRAIALYERLGFVTRTTFHLTVMRRPTQSAHNRLSTPRSYAAPPYRAPATFSSTA